MKKRLTDWYPRGVYPVYVGEYLASYTKKSTILRWWDGEHWSCPYSPRNSDRYKNRCRSKKDFLQPYIYWRGLAEQPEYEE